MYHYCVIHFRLQPLRYTKSKSLKKSLKKMSNQNLRLPNLISAHILKLRPSLKPPNTIVLYDVSLLRYATAQVRYLDSFKRMISYE